MGIVRFSRTNLFKGSLMIVAIILAACLLTLVGTAKPVEAAFPGENGNIAFVSTRDAGNAEIYIMDANGSNQTNLSNTQAYQADLYPAWSPDGTKIAFVSDRDGNNDIYVMNADGSNLTNITSVSASPYGSGYHGDPAWSPDGTKIAFTGYTEGINYDVYTINADGSNKTRLTNHSTSELNPTWSPEGTKIAYTSYASSQDGSSSEIYVMDTNGSNKINITNNQLFADDPSWSPDGTKIAFMSTSNTELNQGQAEIYTISANGSNLTRLTDNHLYDEGPAWSPDGTKIAFTRFVSFQTGQTEIYVMDANGSNQTRLTTNLLSDAQPDWQPLPKATSPKTKDDCKKDRYEAFGFKNQGQCIKAVNNAD